MTRSRSEVPQAIDCGSRPAWPPRQKSVREVTDTVCVIRGEQAMTYVIAEEHDDGSLLLRPKSSRQAIVERTPGPRGSVAADRQGPARGSASGADHAGEERQPEHAMVTGSPMVPMGCSVRARSQ
jgi:hypothetical protein